MNITHIFFRHHDYYVYRSNTINETDFIVNNPSKINWSNKKIYLEQGGIFARNVYRKFFKENNSSIVRNSENSDIQIVCSDKIASNLGIHENKLYCKSDEDYTVLPKKVLGHSLLIYILKQNNKKVDKEFYEKIMTIGRNKPDLAIKMFFELKYDLQNPYYNLLLHSMLAFKTITYIKSIKQLLFDKNSTFNTAKIAMYRFKNFLKNIYIELPLKYIMEYYLSLYYVPDVISCICMPEYDFYNKIYLDVNDDFSIKKLLKESEDRYRLLLNAEKRINELKC